MSDCWYSPGSRWGGCPLGTGTCTAAPGIALKAGVATWQMLTYNDAGYGPWSETREFLVEIPNPGATARRREPDGCDRQHER